MRNYTRDARALRVNDCGCSARKRSCECTNKRKPAIPHGPSAKPAKMNDVDPTPGTMAGVNAESEALTAVRKQSSDPYGMALQETPDGLREMLVSAEEPETPEAEAEKSFADRVRQASDSRDPHNRNFLRAFYQGRANERARRAS